jgi:hypothetical protein
MVRFVAIAILMMFLLSVPATIADVLVGDVFYGVAFNPEVVDSVRVYLKWMDESKLYVKILFEESGKTYESICSKVGVLKDSKILKSLDNNLLITIYSDGVSGIIENISFIALKSREKAVKIHEEALRKLLDSGIVGKNKEVEKNKDLQTQQHKQGIQVQNYEEEYGRFGYIQGVEGGQYYWKIYMDVLGQRRAVENYDHTKLKASTSKYFRVEILTTQQWPYPEGEPMIWQNNAFKICILTSDEKLDPWNPAPSGDGGFSYVIIPLWLPGIGYISITISWAQVRATTFKDVSRLEWTNYGPRKSYPDYLAWNEILGSLNNDRPRDVGVRLNMGYNDQKAVTRTFTVSGSVIIHQYEGGYLISHWIDFPSKTFSITIIL